MAEHRESPTQGVFIGWMAIGLMGLMALATLTLLVAGLHG